MLARVTSAIIGLLVLIISLSGPKYIFTFALFIVSLIGLLEVFNILKVSSVGFKYIGSFALFMLIFFYNNINILYASLFLLILFPFILVIFSNNKNSIQDVYITIVGTIIMGILMSYVLKVRDFENGSLLVWLIFIGAWTTDTFAYYFGIRFGKHKLTPISPKKSIEGSIAGFVACILFTILFGYFMQIKYGVSYAVYNYIIIGIISGILSQIGDLSASLLKRSVDAKDFGTIMPGHGGVLDRFDSVLFVAPGVYFYLYYFMNLS